MFEFKSSVGLIRTDNKRYEPPDAREKSYVIDGDTVVVGGQHWRLEGFDAPECEGRSHCEDERALGKRAADYLTKLIVEGAQRGSIVATVRSKKDKNGRFIVRFEIDGRSVGDILVSNGLAVEHHGGPKKPFCSCRYRHDLYALQLKEHAQREARRA